MKIKRWLILLCLLVMLSLAAAPVLAETTTYDLSWWTVDSGGTMGLTSGSYTLSGTAGQPDAGVLSNSDYVLAGGFWAGILVKLESFLPLIKK
jgi:hypothetical protein